MLLFNFLKKTIRRKKCHISARSDQINLPKSMIDTSLKHCGKSQPPNKTNLFPSRDAECLDKEEDYQQLNFLLEKN